MKSLREESERAARRLDEANAAFAPTPGEQAVAWARLQDHWDGVRDARAGGPARASGLRWLLGAGALATLGAILWLEIPRRPADVAPLPLATRPSPAPLPGSGPTSVARAPTAAPVTPEPGPGPAVEPSAPEDRPAPVALRPGRSLLAAGVRARLAPRGAASVRTGSRPFPSVVSLQQGRLDIAIDSARPGASGAQEPAVTAPRLEVQVTGYRIAADPGRFSVQARGQRVDVVVKSGKVAVWSSRRLLATVVAGERWTNLPAGQGAGGAEVAALAMGGGGEDARDDAGSDVAGAGAPPSRNEPPQAPADAPDCGRLTRQGAIDPALACFARAAEQPGLAGELALIELARIRRDVKGDLAGAERALAEHRRRFPRGALADEATGSRVELLLRLGRASEALSESEHIAGSDAVFWRAECLSKLGRRTEAAQAFDDYLTRPDGKRRSEAERMRAELQRP